MTEIADVPTFQTSVEDQRRALAKRIEGRNSGKYTRVVLAALSGIPWVGSLFSAAASYMGDVEQGQTNELQKLWLQEHQEKLRKLGQTLEEMSERFETFGEDLQERIQSEEYLALVRSAFRSWDQADTDEKREFIRKLLTNAGGTKLCPDDLVRLFISWIDRYHESHFAVIRVIHREPGVTRAGIWKAINGATVREDSAEADLFKLLIRDLSMGEVIRQHRDTTAFGEYMRKGRAASGRNTSGTLKSAFDDQDGYELTGLGRQFVHYVLDELVARIGPG
ncbi:MAG TPA: hypothetical protein VG407_17290 [Caulobacteraceae bacterium]|jgi:hypothetical protein|nr:hypothetical protein [Caulobacteraceae bacterium]